ncbi:CoA ester lyase [Nocardioides sp. NPDC023903]|uniref:HpcH/HpaI aldolase/citrate lyase family protein n=1 Tax=Nocardioides sp. NPDC023903 TaxID=3157195 RepID=UPI0033D04D7E
MTEVRSLGTPAWRQAVTWLFVPGDRPDRFAKAAASAADRIVIDLEDAVAPGAKADARTKVVSWLDDGQERTWVRVNGAGTTWHARDLEAISSLPGLEGVMLPRSEDPDHLAFVKRHIPETVGVIALIETAVGIVRANEIAASGYVGRLAFGSIDYAVDISASETDEAMLMARSLLVTASRAGGLPGPLDGVTIVTDDTDAIGREARRAKSLGFAGKMCIHPRQLGAVNAAFLADPAEVSWARGLLDAVAAREAAGESAAAFQWQGAMIDRPVLARAHSILARVPGAADSPRR